MSVDKTTRKQTFTLDGSTTEFTFTFNALRAAPTDIKCRNITTDTDLTYTTDYSVVVNTDGSGGVATLVSAGTANHKLLVYRETTDTQDSVYDDYNQFPADTVEKDFDRRTLRSQELEEAINRAVKADITSSLTGSALTLPSPTAGLALKWGDNTIINSTYDPDEQIDLSSSYATISGTKATEAATSATEAATSATTATEQATAAATSATTSTEQAAIATTQATISTDKAAEASTSAATALEHANTATTQATIATEKATEAATSATTATEQAAVATTQATIAAGHAGDASDSATTALTHSNTSLGHANNASDSADTATTQATIATSEADRAEAAADSIDIPAPTTGTIGQVIQVAADNKSWEFGDKGEGEAYTAGTGIIITNSTISVDIDDAATGSTILWSGEKIFTTIGTLDSELNHLKQTSQELTVSNSTIAWNMNEGANGHITLPDDTAVSVSTTNVVPGGTYRFEITQAATASTLVFGSEFIFPGGVNPVISSTNGAIDTMEFIARSNSTLKLTNAIFDSK